MTSQGQLIKPHWRSENYGTYCLFSDQESAMLESHPHSHDQKPASIAATSIPAAIRTMKMTAPRHSAS